MLVVSALCLIRWGGRNDTSTVTSTVLITKGCSPMRRKVLVLSYGWDAMSLTSTAPSVRLQGLQLARRSTAIL